MTGETAGPAPRYTLMKLAIFALVIFMIGVTPGLKQYAGLPPDAPSSSRLAQQTQFQAQHPVLTKLTQTLKLRL